MIDLLKYLFVGGSAAILDLIIFYVFAESLQFNYLLVSIAGFIFSTALNYWLGVLFVFKSGISYSLHKEIILVYLVSLVALAVQLGMLFATVEWANLSLMISKVISMGAAFVFNFSLRKYFVFKEN